MRVVILTSLLAVLTSAAAFCQVKLESRTLVGEITKIDPISREARLLTETGELEVDYAIVTHFARANRGVTGRDSLEVGDAVRVIFLGEPDSADSTVEFVEVLDKNDSAYRDFADKKHAIDRSKVIRVAVTRLYPRNTAEGQIVEQKQLVLGMTRTGPSRTRLPDTARVVPLLTGIGLTAAGLGGLVHFARRRR